MVAWTMAASGQRHVMVVNGEAIRLFGDWLQVAFAAQLHFAVSRRVAMRGVGVEHQLAIDASVDFTAQVAERDPFAKLR